MLIASDLTFAYPSAPKVLDGWSERFESGEVVAITGPSGRGKSTLLYLLGLMLSPSSGCVEVNGVVASALSDKERAKLRASSFGFVFQDAALDASRTVLDNVIETALYGRFARADAIRRANTLMDAFGVSVRASARPGQVSGGQAQRIALCRALLNRPDVVLADEPTGNLDQGSAAVVIEALRTSAEAGATVVIVTHDPSVVEKCDRQVEI